MASSISWSTETHEKINYTKLCRLLVDGGTQAVRSVFDGIHPPSSLKAILNANKTTLQKLKKPKGKVLNDEQWDQLYPPSGSDPKSEDFDITLLFVLLRNICGLTAPVYEITASGKRKRHWDKLPHKTETSQEASLARIKYYRNTVTAHRPNTEICDADFEQHWQDISSALVSLGLSQDEIDDLKSAPLGKKDYNQLLKDWYISDWDIKTQLEEVKSDTADLKSDTADLKSDTTDIKSDTADMREKLDDIRNVCMTAQKMDDHIKELAFSDFRPEINTKYKLFHPNTRQWILDQVKSHVDSDQSDSCIMLITAGPGMGKSTLAAKICQTYTDQGCLAGCHFFQFSNSTRNNPRLMLQSIAQQMCDTLPGYQNALESKLQRDLGKEISKMNCEELLTILFEEPLCNVDQPKSNLVVVIDALDECSLDPKDELLKALRKKLSCFPPWLRFVLTSRPSTNTSALGPTVAVKMEADDQANINDLELFFSFKLKDLYPQGNNHDNADLIDRLVKMTKGLFLVAFFIIDYLKRENVALPGEILELFPNGISSVFENYFSRLKEVLLPYISEEERFYKMLEAVVATNNPLPKDMFYDILCLKSEREVPRQERKTRKDALNTLHWLFPVEEDHVTAFHKSVIDWLTLEKHQEHYFSVRVEEGEQVLASQCNNVLSDIRNGKKDLDKALDLTDSETYALEFLAYAVNEGLAVVKADKYGFFSNIYILTALIIETTFQSDAKEIPESIIPSSLLDILGNMGIYYHLIMRHARSCGFFRPYPFGFCLALLLQASHAEGGSAELRTPKPIDALKKHCLPYYDKSLLLTSDGYLSSFQQCLLNLCKDGFIAVFHMSRPNPLTTTVYRFQLDGRVHVRREFISERKLIAASPNVNFLVAFEENGRKIDILDATTLEVVSQCESPHDAIETCHVFGDDQGFFIVIKDRHDNKVYVIEGLTGRVRNTITVAEGSEVKDVSCQGHIVVSRTWKCKRKEKRISFTNKDGELVELMNWENWEQGYFAFRNVFLYHHDRGEERIPLHPLAAKMCHCAMMPKCEVYVDVHVSGDGRLLAYHYKDSVFIINTSDGSLFKRCPLGTWSVSRLVILFVSSSYLVIIDEQTMFVINVKTVEFEHTIYLPSKVGIDDINHYVLLPEEDGTSFNLIIFHQKSESNTFEVSRLVFHNLNLQGLQ